MSTTDVSKWSDSAMYTAEPIKAEEGPVSYLLSAPADPLGSIAATSKMYKGEVVRDLADVTEEERRHFLAEIQKTALKMPLESVNFHFMLEGVHRGITHQMVRQRTAAYAQESTRFAVKEDLATATALPPSLADTLSKDELVRKILRDNDAIGLIVGDRSPAVLINDEYDRLSVQQRQRLIWDEAVQKVADTYNQLVNEGMPAEEARGLMPTNIMTRLHYITSLRNFYETMAVRVSDQAQFEWRQVAMAHALALIEFGKTQSYWTYIHWDEYTSWDQKFPSNPILEREIERDPNAATGNRVKVRLSSAWQYEALAHEIKPIEFRLNGPAFGADFDRPSRIGERVRAFASKGINSDSWTSGSVEHQIPPINPAEWLFDPHSARLAHDQEFDLFGNRVPKGTGVHWVDGNIVSPDGRLVVWDGSDTMSWEVKGDE